MIPDLGESPLAGARVVEGALVVSFGLTSGTLRMSVGTSPGDDDVVSTEVSLPATVPFTVPAVPVLFVNVWVENGFNHTYSWAWGVGTGTRAPGQVEHEAEVGHLVDSWSRSALASYDQGLEVPDPGHGRDEISPVTFLGQPFSLKEDKAVGIAPFSINEITDGDVGTGYLSTVLRPLRTEVTYPGCPPIVSITNVLEVHILTPFNRGPELAYLYAAVVAMIFRDVFLRPGEAGIQDIRNVETIPDIPVYRGDDGQWSRHQLDVELVQRRLAESAGAR